MRAEKVFSVRKSLSSSKSRPRLSQSEPCLPLTNPRHWYCCCVRICAFMHLLCYLAYVWYNQYPLGFIQLADPCPWDIFCCAVIYCCFIMIIFSCFWCIYFCYYHYGTSDPIITLRLVIVPAPSTGHRCPRAPGGRVGSAPRLCTVPRYLRRRCSRWATWCPLKGVAM